jgi:CheY-like chemotaxis protein
MGSESGSGAAVATAGGRERARLLNVLVVDDQFDLARSLSRLLIRWGHGARIARDGASALEQARNNRPDLVLLDIGLPGMNGYEVARRLRDSYGPELTIVALTGFSLSHGGAGPGANGGSGEHDLAALFDHHPTKPVSPEDLQALIER